MSILSFSILLMIALGSRADVHGSVSPQTKTTRLHVFAIVACPWICNEDSNQELSGLLVEIVREVFKEMPQYKLTISPASPARMNMSGGGGPVAGLIGADFATSGISKKNIAMGQKEGILILRNGLTPPKKVPKIEKLDENFLKQYKLGIFRDYIPLIKGSLGWYLKKYMDDPTRVAVVSSTEGYASLLRMMANGRVDLLIAEQALLDYYVHSLSLPKPTILQKSKPRKFYVLGFFEQPEWNEARDEFSKKYTKALKAGRFDSLCKKYHIACDSFLQKL